MAVTVEAYTSPPVVEITFSTRRKSGVRRREARGCHLAKQSEVLYVSDLHVSTCSKYICLPLSAPASAGATRAPRLLVGTGTAERERHLETRAPLPRAGFESKNSTSR